jgi:esterase/lipase superfamily enzyme
MGAGALLVWGAMASVHFQERADRELRLYGGERGELEMGTCLVSIPHIHRLGELEAPSIWRLELHEDPARHVVLLETQVQPADQFFTRLRERVANSPRKDCFVFIHGYANTFEDAARRTAQMAHDLEFAGAAVFFSWPAQGGVLDYVTDRENMDWAVGDLEQFLLDVARQSQARSIHLIAHSMGNRGLTAALRSVARELEDGPLFHQVVLTAPDIDAAVFRRSIMPEIRGTAERFTLYASANDAALKLSRQFNGFPRVGDTNDGLVVLPGLDTIDVSEVDTSLLGHAYYGGNQSVLLDLRELLERGASPAERQFLRPMAAGQLTYWVFRRLPLAEQPAVGPTR